MQNWKKFLKLEPELELIDNKVKIMLVISIKS